MDWSLAHFLTIAGWLLGMAVVFWITSLIVVTAIAQARTAWRHGGYPPPQKKVTQRDLQVADESVAALPLDAWSDGQRPNRDP